MIDALAQVAPGTPLREGLDRILQAEMGALVVIGDGPEVLAICSGGFLLDAEFSPQRMSELAKMDGAIVLASDCLVISSPIASLSSVRCSRVSFLKPIDTVATSRT